MRAAVLGSQLESCLFERSVGHCPKVEWGGATAVSQKIKGPERSTILPRKHTDGQTIWCLLKGPTATNIGFLVTARAGTLEATSFQGMFVDPLQTINIHLQVQQILEEMGFGWASSKSSSLCLKQNYWRLFICRQCA